MPEEMKIGGREQKLLLILRRAKTQKVDLEVRGTLHPDHIFRIMRDNIS
jgi:hypothetical protein